MRGLSSPLWCSRNDLSCIALHAISVSDLSCIALHAVSVSEDQCLLTSVLYLFLSRNQVKTAR